MAYTFDPATNAIVMPKGDTMDISISLSGNDSTLFTVAVFAIFTRAGEDLLRLPVAIVGGVAEIRLANQHTRDLDAGRYKWNIRLIEDHSYDEDGSVIADDDSDDVLTVFGPDISDVPDFWLVENGGRV